MAIVSRTTVRQILDDIQVRIPHTYTEKSLFLWINETMKKIYKDLAVQDYYSFTTAKDKDLYTLPEDCSIEMINSVTMSQNARDGSNPYDWGNFSQLKPYMPNQEMREPGFYDGREGLLGIYPVPQDVRKIDVFYRKKPKMVTNLDDFIEIDDNYVDLVKYNVMSIIAMSGYNPDVELANEYILLYNNLVQKANENKYEQQPGYPIIKNLHHYRRRR